MRDIQKLVALRARAEAPASWRPYPRPENWVSPAPVVVELPELPGVDGDTPRMQRDAKALRAIRVLVSMEIRRTEDGGLTRVGSLAFGNKGLLSSAHPLVQVRVAQLLANVSKLLGFTDDAEVSRSDVAEVLRIIERVNTES